MAALTPRFIGRKGVDGSDGNEIEFAYQVQCTALTDTQETAKAAVKALAPPAGYSISTCTAAGMGRNPHWYDVTIIYKIGGDPVQTTAPLDRPSILSGSWEEIEESYFIDVDGKKVVNSAGDRFDPLPKRKNGNLILQITKNFEAFDAPGYDLLKWTTNAVALTIKGTVYPIDCLLFCPPTVQETYEVMAGTTYHYFAVTFRLALDSNGHLDTFEDRGLYEFGYEPGVGDVGRVPILDEAQMPVTVPRAIDGLGHAAADAADVEEITFRPYERATWGIDFN